MAQARYGLRPSFPVGAPGRQVEQSCSHLSFALDAFSVCHCMFCGASSPQQTSGQMWSMM